jgi:hypothetical protein
MNNHAGRHELKVDALSVPLTDSLRTDYIIIYNINIPIEYFNNAEEGYQVLNKVRNLLLRDFYDSVVSYQITASYQLRNTQTGELRTWTGSFNARNNAPAQLSGFEIFDNDTFIETSLDHIEDVDNRLTTFEETKWVLNQIISIIFSVQSKVKYNSQILNKFPHHGRRSHQTFALV